MAYQPQHFPNVLYMPVLTCNGSGCAHSSTCPVSHLVNAHPVSNDYDTVASGLPLSPISTPLSPSIDQKRVPCLFFAQNRCSKGETCSFSHDVSKPDVNRPCKYFLQGSCRNRESCRFFHASVDAPATAPATPDFNDNKQRGLEEISGLNVTTTSTADADGSVATADNDEPIPLSEPAFNLDDIDPSPAITTNPDEREPFEIPLPPSRDELSPANQIPDGPDEVLSAGSRSVKQEESPDLFPFSQNATSFEPCTFRMTGRCIRESCIVHHDGPVESVFSPIPSQHSPLLADLDDSGKGDWVQFSEAAITQAADYDSPVNYTGGPQTVCNMGFDHSSVPSPPTPTPPPFGPCKYFALGNCRKNNDCPFVHDIRAQPRMPYRSDRMANTSSRPGVCRNHQAGRCWRGSNCRFRHDAERRSPSPRPVYTDIHKSSEEEGSGWLASTDPWGTSDWTTGNEAWGSGNVEPEKSSQPKLAYSEPEANDKSYLDGWSSDFEDASKGVADSPSAVASTGAHKDAAAVDLPDHTTSDTAPVTSQSSGNDDVPVTDWYEEVEQSEHAQKQRQDDWGGEPQPMGRLNNAKETFPSNDSSVDGTVCLFFIKGICNQGEKCIYSHIEPDSSNIKLCHFFARGLCKSGDKCLYSHSQLDSSDVKLCHFFARGLCKNGDACSYFHDKSDSIPAETLTLQDESEEANQDEADSGWLQQTDPWGTDTNATDWATAGIEGWANAKSADDPDMEDSWAVPQTPRPQPPETETPAPSPEPERDFPPQPIYDCLVRFGSGAIPEELVTKFESSTLKLSGYPYGMSHDDLVQLASPYGVVKNTTFNVTPGGLQAHIEFEDSIQAAAARANLNGLQIVNDEETVCIHAQLDCAGSVAGSVFELETARQLQLVWDAPSVSAWAFYATVGIAKHESDRLMGMTGYDIRMSQNHCTVLEAETWTEGFLRISLNPPNYRDPPNSQILNYLGNFGHVESFRVLPIDASDLEVTAFVEFTKAEAAKTARLALKAMKHEFLGNTCIRAQSIVYTAYNCLACPPAAFNLVRDALEPLSTDISTVRHTTQPLQVHIFGRPSAVEVVERNKQSVRNLLFGREMPGVWDPCFDTSTGEEAFRRINNNLTFHVRPDRGRQVLRIWGNSSDAEKQITRLIKVVEAKRHSISLDDACMPPLVRGELAEIQDTFGASKVLLDAHKQTLIIVGDDAKKTEVENRLEILVSCHSPFEPGDCSFCSGDILEPVELSCGHVYCSECLAHVVRPVPGVAFTSPVCINQTENSRCLAPIPLPTILSRLSDTDRATLLESALLSFVRSDPNFQFCPAGCPVVYRLGDKGTVYTCAQCELQLCASCVKPMHAGSCAKQETTQSNLEAQ
ncbi:hypothetical protein R3P38DRAFT_3266466 [Favolaschia claudopus]|uniref:RING-type E3 ubiquitin transferase n=1 Tax=Favolaschia claudopus TaxID=2862362 RepID=A0AAW0BZN6_9AGAR